MKRKYITVIIILFLCGKMFPQNSDNKILFLDFKFVKGNPELIGMTTVAGKLKIHKNIPRLNNGIEFATLSSADNILYQNTIEDPTECVYEYPVGDGKIGRTMIKQDTVYFKLRVPYSSAIEKIRLNVLNKTKRLNKSSASSNQNIYEFSIDHNKISYRK